MIIIVSGILPTTTIMTTSMPMVWDAITFTSRNGSDPVGRD